MQQGQVEWSKKSGHSTAEGWRNYPTQDKGSVLSCLWSTLCEKRLNVNNNTKNLGNCGMAAENRTSRSSFRTLSHISLGRPLAALTIDSTPHVAHLPCPLCDSCLATTTPSSTTFLRHRMNRPKPGVRMTRPRRLGPASYLGGRPRPTTARRCCTQCPCSSNPPKWTTRNRGARTATSYTLCVPDRPRIFRYFPGSPSPHQYNGQALPHISPSC